MDLGYDLVVTISGMVLVFLILILLMLIITLEGKLFDALGGKGGGKPAKAAPAPAPAAPKAPPAGAKPAVSAPPRIEAGIPGEVVAVIAAAVCAMSGGRYTLRAVRRADKSGWNRAGISDTTAPF